MDYWLEAGRRTAERSANLEAMGHLTRALETLELLPKSAGRVPRRRRDPFDRMLIAQARVELLALLTRDRALIGYRTAIR